MLKFFGTDGVRGTAGTEITAELAFRLGRAAGLAFSPRRALLAMDTRLSGPALAAACAAGLAETGCDVCLGGVLPSPAVSHLVPRERFGLGVVISASHNPPGDNGVKFYGPGGMKLSPEDEHRVESLLDSRGSGTPLGDVHPWPEAQERYADLLRGQLEGTGLRGCKIALDCAHGATAIVAPDLFRALGVTLSVIGGEADGSRINATGATHTGPLSELVRAEEADVGIAYDGDGDRLMLVDGGGQVVEGDRLMAGLAPHLLKWRELRRPAVVFTVLANLGAERYLSAHSIEVLRVPVGDRHVALALEQEDVDLGGEPSGHIVFRRHAATGDGILASLLVLGALQRLGCDLAELVREVELLPQLRCDVPVEDRSSVLERPHVKRALESAHALLDGGGRLLVRPSGTQHVIRVMAEGEDVPLLQHIVQTVQRALQEASSLDGQLRA